ncbi:MAG: hypothetical protein ACTS4Z_02170 [Candidatus Hodgkinia cicadicola]
MVQNLQRKQKVHLSLVFSFSERYYAIIIVCCGHDCYYVPKGIWGRSKAVLKGNDYVMGIVLIY